MKTALGFSAFVVLGIWLIFPIPIRGWHGSYNTFSRLIWCETDFACYHEVGHKLDQEGGWISRTDDFAMAVQAYLILEFQKEHPDPLVFAIMETPGMFKYAGPFTQTQAELYARIFEYSRGDPNRLDARLRPFYDWERANELTAKIIARQK